MSRAQLDTLIVALVVGGALIGVGLAALLLDRGRDAAVIAAFVLLVQRLLEATASIVRNRFPGPEIDVVPPTKEPVE